MTKEKAIKSNVEMHNFWFVELKTDQQSKNVDNSENMSYYKTDR